MSEAKTADRVVAPAPRMARAVLDLFELLVANARDKGDNVAELEAWADEHKPSLEAVLRGR